MKVDFHCHSTASDGTLAPRELAELARDGGFRALALTDHDNADGLPELFASGGGGVAFVSGVELSIEPGAGFDRFHLLGLGIGPGNAELKALLARTLAGRDERNARMLENFAKLGIDIPEGELSQYAGGEVLARPHFARWLADHGYAASAKDAFRRYLTGASPAETRCYERRWRPAQEDAFAAVHAAGGLCVMAHPKFWRDAWRTSYPEYADVRRELARLKEAGLDGLEAIYQANAPSEDVEFTRIADELGLLKTAGSDFHGLNKPAITLGMDVSETFIAPLLERLDA